MSDEIFWSTLLSYTLRYFVINDRVSVHILSRLRRLLVPSRCISCFRIAGRIFPPANDFLRGMCWRYTVRRTCREIMRESRRPNTRSVLRARVRAHKYPERQWRDFAFKHVTLVRGWDYEGVGAGPAARKQQLNTIRDGFRPCTRKLSRWCMKRLTLRF